MYSFPNGHMIVAGKFVNEIDFDAFLLPADISNWADALWPVAEEALENGKLVLPEGITGKSMDIKDVFGEEFHTLYMSAWERARKAEELQQPVYVKDVAYKAIYKFAVFHSGWESDADGFVVETPEGPKYVLSNHGTKYFAKEEEVRKLVNKYCRAIDDTEVAISMVNGK